MSGAQIEELRGYVDEKNMLAIELFMNEYGVGAKHRERIMQLPALYGGEEVLERAGALTGTRARSRRLTRCARYTGTSGRLASRSSSPSISGCCTASITTPASSSGASPTTLAHPSCPAGGMTR